MECGVDKVDTQNADGLLLEDIGSIAHIDVQQDVVGRTAGLQLEPETDPTMWVIGSGETNGWVSATQLRHAPPLGHLFAYLLASNFLVPMRVTAGE